MVGNAMETNDDWHLTQNDDYLTLLESRLAGPTLLWVDQFIEIINRELKDGCLRGAKSVSINDYGCNVGHFYRGVAKIECSVIYHGFDISHTYLSVAKRFFGGGNFHYLDLEACSPSSVKGGSDIAIISATLEHIDDYEFVLRNIFSLTSDLVILRTFIGSVPRNDMCRTIGARSEYLIRQFTMDNLSSIALAFDWSYRSEVDRATLGATKMVCNGNAIPRAQAVLIFARP